jgi:hypothetical protein
LYIRRCDIKWFKHDARARNDAKLAKIIIRYGIEGYGLYFACLEIIAEELTPENFTFELEHDSELLAAMFKMDTLRVEKIMRDFIELGLFEVSDTSNRVACYKLAKRMDNATSQNKEVQSILSNFKKLKVSASDLKQIRLDEIRLEEKREDKKTCAEPPAASAPAVLKIILNCKSLHPITQQDINDWQELFPAVNVIQELRKMAAWAEANPQRRKTDKGIRRFIVNWLSKEQDKGHKVPAVFTPSKAGAAHLAMEEVERRFREQAELDRRNSDGWPEEAGSVGPSLLPPGGKS